MKVDKNMARALPSQSAPRAYLMSWMAVAAFGLGYLGVAATRPDLLSTILPLAEQSPDQALNGRNAADIADEVASLRKWVNDLQHEVAGAKTAVQEQAAKGQLLAQRVAAAEERLPPVREVRADNGRPPFVQRVTARPADAPARPEAAPKATVAAVAERAPASADASASVPAEPGPNAVVPKVLNAAVATSNITTGSVPQPATAAAPAAGFGPAKVTAAAPAAATVPRAIVIGATDSLDSLRVRWGELTERNAEELKALAPRYRLAADAKGAPFTLLAGPFESNADATRTCNALRAKGVACRVGDYTGSAF